MGRQIVYCEGCGHNLREDDFEKGRARMIDNRPFCTECRPLSAAEAQASKRGSSPKLQAQGGGSRKSATGAIPVLPAPPRRPAGQKASNPLPVIAGVGGVALVILLVALSQGGSKKTPTVETVPPVVIEASRRVVERPPTTPPPPPPPPPPVRREPPVAPPPTGPLVAPTASEKLDAFLSQIRALIQSDERHERTEEILNMFSAAAKVAGVRSAEVARMKSEFIGTLDENARRAALWGDWRITSFPDPARTQLLPSHNGRDSVYMTHPLDRGVPAKLERDVDVPAGKKTTFSFWVSCHQQGDFELRVYVDGKAIVKEPIGPPGSGWRQKTLDLTPYAGKKVALRVENFPTDWSWEHAYWSDFAITSE